MEEVARDAINMVETEQPLDDGAGAVDEVSLSDLMQSGESGDGTVADAPAADAHGGTESRDDDAQKPIVDQKGFEAALNARLAREREHLQRSPEFIAGQMLLRERMDADGIDAKEALKRIREERNEARAREYAKNPVEFYKDFLNNRQNQQPQPQNEADTLASAMIRAQEAGLVPDNFDAQRDLDARFVSDLQKYGAEAALAIWSERKRATDLSEAQVQKSAPKPMRVGGGNGGTPKLDFANMSDEEFARYEKLIDANIAAGKRVVF